MKYDVAARKSGGEIFRIEEVAFFPFDGLEGSERTKMEKVWALENTYRVTSSQQGVRKVRTQKAPSAQDETFHVGARS